MEVVLRGIARRRTRTEKWMARQTSRNKVLREHGITKPACRDDFTLAAKAVPADTLFDGNMNRCYCRQCAGGCTNRNTACKGRTEVAV